MAVLILLLALASGAQRPTDVVKWSAVAPAEPVAAGAAVKIKLTAKIRDGWKLYAPSQPKGGPVPLEIALAKDAAVTLVEKEISAPKPKVQKDDNFNLETRYYEDKAAFTVPVIVAPTATGKVLVPIDVTFQACGASICLRPFTERVTVQIDIRPPSRL